MSTVKHGDDWRRWLSGAIISCGFFPVLRCWYLYCWIRKQPKCESPDTQSRLLTCMNKNMQFLCPHAIASHRTFTHIYRPHSCTTIDSFACVHFSASVNTCTSFWKAGPADVLPVSTGRQADEQQAHPHLGVCLVLSSPCFWDGYWDLQTGFVFIFEDFMVRWICMTSFPPEPCLCAVWDELWGTLSLETCSPFLHTIKALRYLIYFPLFYLSGEKAFKYSMLLFM